MTEELPLERRRYEAIAADLCVQLLLRGKEAGHFAMAADELMLASRLSQDLFEMVITWAAERDWLRARLPLIELKAAGIYVAKETLDLPR